MQEPVTAFCQTYRLPLPPRGVGSNARGHWSARARVTREYRETCAAAYRAQGVPAAPLETAHVAVEMRVCRKRVPPAVRGEVTADAYRAWRDLRDRYRPLDAGNVFDVCKAAIDALQVSLTRPSMGAGVVTSDRGRRMSVGAPGLVEVPSFEDEGVWLTVTEGML